MTAVDGGEPKQLTHTDPGESSHAWPHFLPNSRAVLFTILVGENGMDLD
jgi:hypothetical protein